MVTIEVSISPKQGRVFTWLFDGRDEESALNKAKRTLASKNLRFVDYILA